MRIVTGADRHLAQYGNELGALDGSGQVAPILSRALNTEGNKGRMLIRQALIV